MSPSLKSKKWRIGLFAAQIKKRRVWAGGRDSKCCYPLVERGTDVEARRQRWRVEGARHLWHREMGMKGGEENMNIKKKIPSAAAQNKDRTLISPRMLALVTQPWPSFFYLKDRSWLRGVANNTGHAHTHTHTHKQQAKSAEMPHPCKVCVSACYA